MPLPALGATVTGFLMAFVVASGRGISTSFTLDYALGHGRHSRLPVGELLFHRWHSAA